MHAALVGPLLAALLVTTRARPQPPDGGQCRPPGSQRDLNSFLWTIRRDPPAYLFGTIHVPYTRVWDFIPDNSKAAFQASARVYFELDLTDPYTISALASCQLLPHGENLQDVLPRELYWRLKRHLDYVKLMMPSWMTPAQRGKGLYADYLFNAIAGNWERKRPVWVMLMVNSLTETDVRSRGVPVLDLYLAQQAEKMKKSTGAVERVEEQCHPLNGLNFSQVGTWHPCPHSWATPVHLNLFSDCLTYPAARVGPFSLWERSFQGVGSSPTILWWCEGEWVCNRIEGKGLGVCFCFGGITCWGNTLPTCCACLSRKNFPLSIRVNKNKKRELLVCVRLSRDAWCPGSRRLSSRPLCRCTQAVMHLKVAWGKPWHLWLG
ncbi:metalloprotease TIKI2-like [Loxodonta africana]|uniref:metalloprotease TIKI2-like n=1 Tax=Loxodonta africana TaxID=9785 RepID=UPI0030CCBE4D